MNFGYKRKSKGTPLFFAYHRRYLQLLTTPNNKKKSVNWNAKLLFANPNSFLFVVCSSGL